MLSRIASRFKNARPKSDGSDFVGELDGMSAKHFSRKSAASKSSITARSASNPQFQPLQGLNNISSATHQVSGTRHRMEDFSVSCAIDETTAMFGVFDGHGGQQCSQFFVQNLPRIVRAEFDKGQNDESNWGQVLRKSLQTCGQMWDKDPASHRSAGTVGVVVLVSGSNYTVAHVGDCGVVASAPGPTTFLALTTPHHAKNTMEKERILQLGGKVEDDRLMGVLCPSRAFGNLDLRSLPGGQSLVSECDIVDQTIQLDHDNQGFLIIASDGVWDIYSPAEASKIVSNSLAKHGSASIAATTLATHAARSNMDDVTVTVVFWKAPNVV